MSRADATRVALPVVQPGAPRSRASFWRAVSLVLVHVLVLAHLAHWWWRGSTLSPLEPSEAGHSIRDGAINAGAVFLVVLILSTLVFGRFFCGWACHVVAYQDLARWLLVKIGLRPRPVRSRLLVFVPLFAAYWLYGKPLVDRWRAGTPAPDVTWHLTTQDFWITFPGVWISILTFLVCGFLIVYVLGAKGFCTYGCPYGGLFAIADRFAPVRIRVSDACDGAGQCTVHCTSNVNVAREVREYGMVVDPGCLKCMDCVSLCPNDALHVGTTTTVTAPRMRFRRLAWLVAPETILALGLGVGAALLFHRSWASGVVGALVVAVVAAAWQLALRPGRRAERPSDTPDYTLAEEVFIAAMFAVTFAIFFRLYRIIPLLMAIGMAAIAAYFALIALRLLVAPRVRLQNLVLKADGRWRAAAWGFAACMLLAGAAVAHGGIIQWHTHAAVTAFNEAEAARATRDRATYETRRDRAAAHLAAVHDHGVIQTRGIGRMLGEIERWEGRPDAALPYFALEAGTKNSEVFALDGLARWAAGGDRAAALDGLERGLGRTAPRDRFLKFDYEFSLLGDEPMRLWTLRRGLEFHPGDPTLAFTLATLLVRTRDPALRNPTEALAVAASAADQALDTHPDLLGLLGWLYADAGRFREAEQAALASARTARAVGRPDLAADMERAAAVYRSSGSP